MMRKKSLATIDPASAAAWQPKPSGTLRREPSNGHAPPVQTAAPADERYEPAFPIKGIVPSKTNQRKTFDKIKLQELAESIRQKGVLEPLLARPLPSSYRSGADVLELVAGERRLRAAELAGETTVPVRILHLTDTEAVEVQTIENLQREDLDPIEEAQGFQSLMDTCLYAVETIAQKVGVSPASIYASLKLLNLPKAAVAAVRDGTLSASIATLIGRVPNAELRQTATNEILGRFRLGETMSFKSAKEWVERELTRELKGAPFDQADAKLTGAGPCSTCPKRTGNDRAFYPDGRADICTDTACFGGKVKAAGLRKIEEAKAKGRTVLEGKKAKGVFNEYGDCPLAYNAGYVDLASRCYETPNPSDWRKLLLPDAEDKIVTAIDPNGLARELVPKEIAARILKDKGLINRQTNRRDDGYSRQMAAAQKKRERDKQVGKVLAVAVPEALADPALCKFIDLPLAVARPLIKSLLKIAWSEIKTRLEKLYGTNDLDKHVDLQGSVGCLSLLCQLVILERFSGGYNKSSTHADALIEALGLDPDNVVKQLAYDAASKKKAGKK